jgi:hypothetical protein
MEAEHDAQIFLYHPKLALHHAEVAIDLVGADPPLWGCSTSLSRIVQAPESNRLFGSLLEPDVVYHRSLFLQSAGSINPHGSFLGPLTKVDDDTSSLC